jgi:2-oxoacid:acceptor oxidoreductase delta subunit (pyruvate/2-ketoisovalerate family)
MIKFKSRFESSWADPRTMHVLPTGEWRFQRPVIKAEKCCQCGWCYIFCPAGCIEDRGTYFEANLDYCKGCSICAKVCPVDAIRMVREEIR